MMKFKHIFLGFGALAVTFAAKADIPHLDDVYITGSQCVGFDCANGISYGFDTVILKENNLRFKFEDTSTSASFPTNDWRLVANDTSNGGGSYLAIEDSNTSRQVFRVDAGARANALRVDAQGDVGIGKANPVVNLHIVTGNTPTVRLEQDGSSGFTAQTWDMAGNEANFFIRDVTNGSQLPFRIQPGAGSDSLYIANDEQIGLGTTSPDALLHLQRGGSGNDGLPRILMDNTDYTNPNGTANGDWVIDLSDNGDMRISLDGSGAQEFSMSPTGNLTVTGTISSGGTVLNVPDYVFDKDYKLPSLDEVASFIDAKSHLPDVPSAKEINANGLNMSEFQMVLLKKVEELTLYTLAQEKTIRELNAKVDSISVD